MSMNRGEMLLAGYVSGVHGLGGWLKIFSCMHPRASIANYKNWWLDKGDDRLSLFRLCKLRARMGGKGLAAKLEGVGLVTEAQRLFQCNIYLRKSDLPPLPSGEFYWHQLVGMQVINCKGKILGSVDRLIATGAADVLMVKGTDRYLIPFKHPEIVYAVEDTVIRVHWEDDWL